ncbi:MAG: rod shape-determining protein MreC [Candidatus Delongbacteria bacterium]|nr:rod shape-determining protein MreC [Candidatus Delongbacteria bacterium]MCG2760891.1 rod shape-determining protein MreC [Candidatus Delongbacteria bacterium]
MKTTPKYKLYREWIYLFSSIIISSFFIAFNGSSFNDTLSSAGLDAYSLINYDYFSFREKSEMQMEIAELKKELILSENDRVRFADAYDENIRLRELMSIDMPDSLEFVYAKIAGIDPNSYNKSILINAGTEKNIQPDDIVISLHGVVGTVMNSGNKISKVKLISNPSNKIAVRTEKSRANGILIPLDQNYAKIEEITKTSEVFENEKIYTADFSTIYPPDLLIGEVVSVSDSSATINKKIRVRFLQNMDLIEDVFVVKRIPAP